MFPRSCAIWRENEREVTVVKQYILDTQMGTMQEEPIQGKTGWDGTENQQENTCLILAATLKEFEASEILHPCKKELLHSLNCEKYCKVEFFHNCIQGIIRSPLTDGHRQKPFLFGFLLYQNMLWFVSDDTKLPNMVEQIREELYEGFSIQDFLLAFFNHLIERDMSFLQKIEDGLERMEEKVLDRKETHLNEAIMQNRRKLSQRHGYYVQLMNIGDYMQSILREQAPDAESGWSLFTHRVERLHGYVEMMREHLLQIREMYQTQVDIEQNRIVTFLTVITTIFLPLTLVTGWYGMNFVHMPELGWKYGYLIIIVLSVIVVVAEIHYCKKRKML